MVSWFFPYSLAMSSLPFPADSAEYEEYAAVMGAMADEAESSTPDYSPDEESDELRAREDEDYWQSLHDREDDSEDRYLDSSWEDANEYGMEGCCGDF